jgi:hypothetical protein
MGHDYGDGDLDGRREPADRGAGLHARHAACSRMAAWPKLRSHGQLQSAPAFRRELRRVNIFMFRRQPITRKLPTMAGCRRPAVPGESRSDRAVMVRPVTWFRWT